MGHKINSMSFEAFEELIDRVRIFTTKKRPGNGLDSGGTGADSSRTGIPGASGLFRGYPGSSLKSSSAAAVFISPSISR